MDFELIPVSSNNLLVDPNNPRYFDLREHRPISEERYAEQQIQVEAIAKLIASEEVETLRKSILTNGFINIEYIVVKEYEHAENQYLVIEGNRRVAAILGIRQDFARGTLPQEHTDVANTLESIDVLKFQGNQAEEKIIQGIRHVAGPKGWKPYQQAQLVLDLHGSGGMSFSDIQDSLGLGPTVVRRLYNTVKAFEQMRNDDEYGDFAERSLFSLFLEMLKSPNIRNWLRWSDDDLEFQDSNNRKRIYQMIVGESSEEGDSNPVITNPDNMRDFGKLLGHEHRIRVLDRINPGDLSIAQAWAILEPGITPWQESVANVSETLERLAADELQQLNTEQEGLLRDLAEVVSRKLEQSRVLRGT